MIDVINNILKLVIQFINELFRFKVDINNQKVSILTLAISFVAILVILYLVFRGLGILSKGDD